MTVASSLLRSRCLRRVPLLVWTLVVASMGAVLLPLQASAQDVAAGAFSRLGASARGVAMGNALAASPAADVSPYYNPALAPNSTGQRIAASAALMSFDRELQTLEFTTPLGPTAGIGVGLLHAGVNDIDGRDADGRRTETLSTDEFGFALSFGNRFAERLSVGAALKLYQADYLDRVDAVRTFALDLGATVDVTERLDVALVVNDLLAKYEWNTSSAGGRTNTDRFPVRIRVGGHYVLLDGRLRLVGEVESRTTTREVRRRDVVDTGPVPSTQTQTESLRFSDVRARLGAAYRLAEILDVRAGLDRIGIDDEAGMRPSAGFGLRHTVGTLRLRLGYAIVLEPYVNDALNLATLEIYL